MIQTDRPTWLEQAYADAVHSIDTGALSRNIGASHVVATFLHLLGMRNAIALDYAGGYGTFTRLMRDLGFPFLWSDPYAQNLFARGFEWTPEAGSPAILTAFELLEHLPEPREQFRRLAAFDAKYIVASTETYLPPTPSPDWFYLAPESGQHVAFYRPETLLRLGQECGYPFVHPGQFYHLFGREPLPNVRWSVAVRGSRFLFPALRRLGGSRTVEDSRALRRMLGSRNHDTVQHDDRLPHE